MREAYIQKSDSNPEENWAVYLDTENEGEKLLKTVEISNNGYTHVAYKNLTSKQIEVIFEASNTCPIGKN
jgi:hypothetical protein